MEIGAGTIGVVGIPVDVDMDTTIVAVPLGLCRSHIFIVTCQNTGSEELLIGDLAPVFV